MSIRSKTVAVAFLAGAGALVRAQGPQGSFAIEFPKDSPVAVVSSDWGQSRPTPRGGAMLLDLHTSLSLKNITGKRVRGVTLIVLAQEVTPGGKASVSVPSLDVPPGDTFPVRLDLRLLRPVGGDGALVRVALDGVLFDDLSFYGPNKLNSRRSMMVWELEARRDRQYFKQVLAKGGPEALQQEILTSLSRYDDRRSAGVQVVRGRATNVEPERDVQFAFLNMADSPLEAVSGMATVTSNEARAPRIEIRNKSSKPVTYMDLAWIVQDGDGRAFQVGSVPADMTLGPGQKTKVAQDSALRFPERTSVSSMLGVVHHVEFADGKFWIPSRAELADPRLRHTLAPSPEEQRLVQIYRKKGPQALIEELKKF
jgi:hypothetical protein